MKPKAVIGTSDGSNRSVNFVSNELVRVAMLRMACSDISSDEKDMRVNLTGEGSVVVGKARSRTLRLLRASPSFADSTTIRPVSCIRLSYRNLPE
jgi:hypothetical protein